MNFYRAFTNWIFGGLGRYFGLQPVGPTTIDTAQSPPVGFDGAMQLSAVWACVKLLAESLSSLPLNVYELTPRGRVLAVNHPLQQLLRGKVNAYQNRIEFLESVALNLVMTGNAYVALMRDAQGQVISMLPLMSAQVQTTLLQDGTVVHEYTNEGNVRVFSGESIWHLKLMGNGIVGLSVLDYQRDTLNVARGAERSVSKIYANGGKPSGVLMIDRILNEQQREMIRENFNGITEGDQSRLFVLEAHAKYEPISLSPQDIELLASRRFQIEEICRWFGVPSVMINHSATTTWGSGIQTIIDGFYKITLRPLAEKFELGGTIALLPRADRDRYELAFDFEVLLRADPKARMETYAIGIQNAVLTPNEARAKEGLKEDPDGGLLMIQGATVPIRTAGAAPAAPPPPAA
jgi:HK97 family phage portal protein